MSKWGQKYGKDAFENAATQLGYKRVKQYPFNAHGQKVFFDGKVYITRDVDSHNGGVWKMVNKKGTRVGTLDANLNRIKD